MYSLVLIIGAGLICIHGHSVEYSKNFGKKIIYIVYNMYMYKKIENKSISKRILKYWSLYILM
jgi:hypothetical protein